jgi:hypothetical protein
VTHEATISGDELQLLLNLPYPELEVTYPMTGIQLFRATQVREGVQLHVLASPTSFDDKTDSDLWRRERPTWNDLIECSLASGATTYTNLPDFKGALNGYSRTGRVYYAPDTNILYDGFLTTTQLIDPNKVILSDTVKEEIRAHLNYKHGPHQIEELKHSTPYNHQLWDMLLNQRMKQSRKAAALALREYEALSSHALLVEAAAQTTSDKERNDDVFTRTISFYKRIHGVYPVVLTCDAAMVDYCKIENLDYFLFQLPKTIESGLVTHRCFMRLIQTLANVMGFLKVGKVIILGEYQGRRGPDELEVIFPNGDYDWFIKHLKISRNLLKNTKAYDNN